MIQNKIIRKKLQKEVGVKGEDKIDRIKYWSKEQERNKSTEIHKSINKNEY